MLKASLALASLVSLISTPAFAASYLVTYRANQRTAAQTAVTNAGGSISRALPEINLLIVSSSGSGFAATVRRASSVQDVVRDAHLTFVNPGQTDLVDFAEASSINPPTSHNNDFFFDLQWGHDAVNSPEAWGLGARGAGVRVAVLDSGIDATHPDLTPNLNQGLSASFVPGETYNVQPGFYFNHGTHVSGIIGASDNAFGTIGVAPEAELVMVKVLSEFTGSGSFGSIISGIVYAANIDADVINMSLGAIFPRHGFVDDNGTSDPSDDVTVNGADVSSLLTVLGRATSYAYQQGTTIVAAAGNDGVDFDHTADLVDVPAMSPHVIAVSALGPNGWGVNPSTNLDLLAFYSNYGSSVIAFGAPGGNIDFNLYANPGLACNVAGIVRPCYVFDLVFSTIAGGWGWAAGTSMASPHVAGVAALIIGQAGGSLPPAQVEAALLRGADDLGSPGTDPIYGGGRVNAQRSVAP